MGDRAEFLDIHLEAPVPCDIEDDLVGACEVRPHGGREPVAHRPEPSRRDPCPWRSEAVILGSPHLVLPDLAHDDSLSLQERREFLDDELGAKRPVLPVAHGVLLLPRSDPCEPPFVVLLLLDAGEHLLQDGLCIAHDRDIHPLVLADLCRVDVDVDYPCLRCERIQFSRHAVIEPDTDGDEEVCLGDGIVRVLGPVHPEHAQVERVVARDGTKPHQGRRDRDHQGLGEPEELAGRIRGYHAPANVQERPFGLGKHLQRLVDLPGMAPVRGLVSPQRDRFRFGELELDLVGADVLGKVYQYRAWPARSCDVERLSHHAPKVLCSFDEVIVLRDRHRDARDVRLLERVVSKEVCRDLPGEGDDRDGVHVRGRYPCHEVAGPGTGGGQAYAHPAARTGEPVSGMGGCLFMPYEDVPQ